MLAVLLLAVAGGHAFCAVVVRVSAELGRGTALSVRPRAVAGALAQAVGTVAARHTFPAQRTEKAQELKAILARAQSFVTRYSIEEESVEEGVYQMKLSAEVDRESLLKELESAGFSVAKLEAPPRVLVAPGEGMRSAFVARTVSQLLNSEGIPALDYTGEAADPQVLLPRALTSGYHVLAIVTGGVPKAVEEEEGDPTRVGPLPEVEAAPPEGPVSVELVFTGVLLDTRSGTSLGGGELALAGVGPSMEEALDLGAQRGGEDLFGLLVADLIKSEWKLGDAAQPLELKVVGLTSPAQALEFTTLFSAMPELRNVELERIEAKTAAWSARAVNPEGDLVGALSRVKPERGVLQWRAGGAPKSKTPVFEGLWTPK